jgi:hypothetical protein
MDPSHEAQPAEPTKPAEPTISAGIDGQYARTLIYELLDAHVDTLLLASDMENEPGWSCHLTYLRDLQRIAREFVSRG